MPFTHRKNWNYLTSIALAAGLLFSFQTANANPPGITSTKTLDMSYRSPSISHRYDWIRLLPTFDANNPDPVCNSTTTHLHGMVAFDVSGILYICSGSGWENSSDPWAQDGDVLYPKLHSTSKVSIGQTSISNPHAKLLVAQNNTQSRSNRIEFVPNDGTDGNVGIEIWNLGPVSSATRSSSFIKFLVGERGADWDAAIKYNKGVTYYGYDGLAFYGMRNTTNPNLNPDMKIHSNGNVDFGHNTTPRGTQKVRVFGSTKAEKLILRSDGTNYGELKVIYSPSGGGGYYATYAP